MRKFFILATVIWPAVAAADPVGDILASARADCAFFDAGVFDARDAVSEIDLDGDSIPDHIVDEARFACSSRPALFCGTGGCSLHVVIGDNSWRFQAEGWRTVDWDGRTVLLVARDGGWCGGAGAQQCIEAVVWSGGELLTVRPEQ